VSRCQGCGARDGAHTRDCRREWRPERARWTGLRDMLFEPGERQPETEEPAAPLLKIVGGRA